MEQGMVLGISSRVLGIGGEEEEEGDAGRKASTRPGSSLWAQRPASSVDRMGSMRTVCVAAGRSVSGAG